MLLQNTSFCAHLDEIARFLQVFLGNESEN